MIFEIWYYTIGPVIGDDSHSELQQISGGIRSLLLFGNFKNPHNAGPKKWAPSKNKFDFTKNFEDAIY